MNDSIIEVDFWQVFLRLAPRKALLAELTPHIWVLCLESAARMVEPGKSSTHLAQSSRREVVIWLHAFAMAELGHRNLDRISRDDARCNVRPNIDTS
jgi:hypothetical protein